uniref:Putative tail protein n=1 Tax=viral metagenome TaxID=1070528 RepID=A0A6M3L3X6_9ZZZZ
MATEKKTAGDLDFVMEQGGTFSRTFTYVDADSVAVVLTGYTIEMKIREIHESSTVLLTATTEADARFVLSDPTAGEFTLTISATDTAALTFIQAVYDIKLTSPTGNVERLLEGSIKLTKQVTR